MATNVDIRGLDDRGFRIRNAGGSQAVVKRGVTVSVDVDRADVAAQLIRNKSQWVRASTPNVQLRGLTSSDESSTGRMNYGGFRGTSGGVLDIGAGNSGVRYRRRGGGTAAIRVAHVNPGGTAARSITVSGNDVTVNLAVTAGAINGTETASAIATAVNANGSASALVEADGLALGNGTGVVTTQALTVIAQPTVGRVRSGQSFAVNIDEPGEARRLRRNRTNFVVGSTNLISIKGLDDRGFRIKNSGGALVMVRRNAAAVTVNVNDGNVQRVLREHFGHWIEA